MNLSDRFLAKLSNTSPISGNSPKRVADTLYRSWSVLEQEWPTKAANTVEEFYSEIPEAKKTLALARGAEYEFGYQVVPGSKAAIKEALKNSPVCLSVPAWWEENGKYFRPPGISDGHWTVCYGLNEQDEFLIFDSYYPFKKVMRADFLPSMAMSYHLKKKVVNDSAFSRFIRLIKQILWG